MFPGRLSRSASAWHAHIPSSADMSEIVLCTLNARYWHSSFGLRYLLANMGELTERTSMLEFGIKDDTVELVGRVLEHAPKIVGVGVYIWNGEPATRFVSQLKQVAPDVQVVLGGPEVSYEYEQQPIFQDADYLICGEGDLAFPVLAKQLLYGLHPAEKVIQPPPPKFDRLKLPYRLYTDEDIAHRVVYVEVSRGCPFTCEFCLSALEIPVRLADVDAFLQEMQLLLDRGAKQFKFVDRTFNLSVRVSKTILQFFLARYVPGMFLHFEMIPDRMPSELRSLVEQFPPGVLQFEIGVQTLNEEVGDRISRKQDNESLRNNFRWLRDETGVHIHSDLIVGLPGETIESFAKGFDELVALRPQEIQVGILKRLRGTPIVRHDEAWGMRYSPHPPYEIMATNSVSFTEMQRMRRFARFWDLVANSGNFSHTMGLLFDDGSPFDRFMRFVDWLFEKEQKQHGIPLQTLAERLFQFLSSSGRDEDEVAQVIWKDYTAGGRTDKPHFLKQFDLPTAQRERPAAIPPRQARHAV